MDWHKVIKKEWKVVKTAPYINFTAIVILTVLLTFGLDYFIFSEARKSRESTIAAQKERLELYDKKWATLEEAKIIDLAEKIQHWIRDESPNYDIRTGDLSVNKFSYLLKGSNTINIIEVFQQKDSSRIEIRSEYIQREGYKQHTRVQ